MATCVRILLPEWCQEAARQLSRRAVKRKVGGGPEDPGVEYFGERVSTANWNFILVRMRGLCRAQDAIG
jgi:hypothetical protein